MSFGLMSPFGRQRPLGSGPTVSRPSISVPATQTLDIDNATLTFSSGNGNLITIANATSLHLSVTSGTFSLSGTTGLSFSVGDGSGDNAMTFTGSVSDMLAALAGLVYTPSTFGDFSLDITATNAIGTTSKSVALHVVKKPQFAVAPTVSGDPINGTVFACSNGSLIGTPPITVAKQWRVNGADVIGAINDQWASTGLVLDDLLTCQVTAINEAGQTVVVTSQVIIEAAPAFTADPAISGVAQNGETFTLDDDGTHTGTAPITVTKQWVIIDTIDNPVSGANGDTWDSVGLEYGDSVACDVTISNLRGSVTRRSNLLTISPLSITYPDSVSFLESQQPYTITGLSVADVSPSGSYQIDIDAPNFLVTLATGFASLGLTFTVGDGTNDPYLRFTDTSLSDLISAINGIIVSGGVVGETELSLTLTEGATADSITVVIPVTISDVPSNTLYDGNVSRYLTDGASNYLTDGA